jgi:hypothetical protein
VLGEDEAAGPLLLHGGGRGATLQEVVCACVYVCVCVCVFVCLCLCVRVIVVMVVSGLATCAVCVHAHDTRIG